MRAARQEDVMEAKAKVFGHAVHQMLVPFPLGLLTTAAIFDIIYLFTHKPGIATTSFYIILAGIIGGLLAAVFGLVDYLGIPKGTRARRIGFLHGVGNVVMVGIFFISWLLRLGHISTPHTGAIVLSILGAGLGGVTGWLGGELVDRLGVGVDDGANLDAPSSLRHGPARSERMAAD
jgi:uncharacterized membrane protein